MGTEFVMVEIADTGRQMLSGIEGPDGNLPRLTTGQQSPRQRPAVVAARGFVQRHEKREGAMTADWQRGLMRDRQCEWGWTVNAPWLAIG